MDDSFFHAKIPEVECLSRSWVCVFFLGFVGVVMVSGWDYLQGGAPFGDDHSSHTAWMMAVAEAFRTGDLHFFFRQQNLGVPMFLAYQPLSGVVMGGLYALLGKWVAPWTLMKGSILGLWALMPMAWYVGGRWLGLSRISSLVLGLLSVGIQEPYSYGFVFRSTVYRGLFTQLIGMFFFPLALGAMFRYVVRRQSALWIPVLWFWLAFLSHAFLGLFLGIASALLLLVQREGWKQRCLRLFLLYGWTILLLSFWMVPLLLYVGEVGGLPWKTATQQGLPWNKAFRFLLDGTLLDAGRWPWITALWGVSLFVVGMLRRTPLHRWLLVLFGVTLLLWLGPKNWGQWYRLLPLHRELNVMRYLCGIHACVLLFVACFVHEVEMVGRVWWEQGAETADKWRLRFVRFAGVVGILLIAVYLFVSVGEWKKSLQTFSLRTKGFQEVVRHLKQDRESRYVVHRKLGTTNHFHRDLLGALAGRDQLLSYGMTFHATLGLYYAEYFEFLPMFYRLFHVQTLVAKGEQPPSISMKTLRLALHVPPYRVYETNATRGFIDTAQVGMVICGHPKRVRSAVRTFTIPLFRRGRLPLLWVKSSERKRMERWVGSKSQKAGRWPDWMPDVPVLFLDAEQRWRFFWQGRELSASFSRRGWLSFWNETLWTKQSSKRLADVKILSQRSGRRRFQANVEVRKKTGLVFLKVNFFPFWSAFRGEKRLPLIRVAPNYLAVSLPKGQHWIRFVYRNPSWQRGLFWGMLFGWLLLGVSCRRGWWEKWERN